MNIIDLVTQHPIACTLAVAIPIRIAFREIKAAKRVIEASQLVKSTKWDGIERRGPNRAKNVIRPVFGQTVILAEETERVVKTGTNG